MRSKILVEEESLQCLQPGRHINGTVLEAYLRQLERRSIRFPSEMVQILAMDTFIFQDIDANRHGRIIKRWKRINPFLADIVFFPLHIKGTVGHWALIVVRPKIGKIEAFDSLHLLHKMRVTQVYHVLRGAAATLGFPFDKFHWDLFDTSLSTPKQTNTTDCGVYVAWYAERLSREAPIKGICETFSPDHWREHMRTAILDDFVNPMDGQLAEIIPTIDLTEEDIDVIPGSSDKRNNAEFTMRSPSQSSLESWDLSAMTLTETLDQPVQPDHDLPDSQVLLEAIDTYLNPLETENMCERPFTPCLSIPGTQENLDAIIADALEELPDNGPPVEAINDLQNVPLPDPEPITEPPREQNQPINRQRRRRRRQKKLKIFFTGLGWLQIPKRLVRPDLKW